MAGAAVALILIALASDARGETAALDYATSTPDCFDEHALRDAVKGLAGADLFDRAHPPVWVRVRRVATGFIADVEVGDGGARRLESAAETCRDLEAALTLALVVALDSFVLPLETPRLFGLPGPMDPVLPPPRTQAARQERTTSVAASKPRGERKTTYYVMANMVGDFGDRARGAGIGAGGRRGKLAVEGRARFVATAGADAGEGSVQARMVSILAGPCLRLGKIVSCLDVQGAVLFGRGIGLEDARTAVTPHLATGARLGVEWPVIGAVSVRLDAELRVAVTRTVLRVDEMPVWSSSRALGGVTLGIVGSIP